MSVAAPPAPWLIVVQWDQAELFRHLTTRFGDVALVEVILDRRLGDRRGTAAPIATERRRGERRRPATPEERERWAVFGYRLVRPEEAS